VLVRDDWDICLVSRMRRKGKLKAKDRYWERANVLFGFGIGTVLF